MGKGDVRVRDYCNKRGGGEEVFQNSFDKQVPRCPTSRRTGGARGVLERIATPRKDHRHSEERRRATSGLRVSVCDGDRKSITGHARNSTRDRGNRAKYVFGNCSVSFSLWARG